MCQESVLIIESKIAKLKFVIGNLIIVFLCIYLFSVIAQNVIVISTFILIALFILFFSSYKKIEVFSNRLVINYKRILKINSTKDVFYFANIERIETDLRMKGGIGKLVQIIAFFRASITFISKNYFTIIQKDGLKETVVTGILKEDLVQMFRLIKKSSENKIQITGIESELQ